MTLAITILLGIAIGVMVELFVPGHSPGELVLAMLLGTAGALVARLLGEQTGLYRPDEPAAILASGAGAIIVLVLYGWIVRSRRVGH